MSDSAILKVVEEFKKTFETRQRNNMPFGEALIKELINIDKILADINANLSQLTGAIKNLQYKN
jgi:hypothetical protein